MIVTFNRIITNTIEQSVIFSGLYFSFLYGSFPISGEIILVLGSLFVIGRVTFGIGYSLATMTKIATLRSFGASMTFTVNMLMASYILGMNALGGLQKVSESIF